MCAQVRVTSSIAVPDGDGNWEIEALQHRANIVDLGDQEVRGGNASRSGDLCAVRHVV